MIFPGHQTPHKFKKQLEDVIDQDGIISCNHWLFTYIISSNQVI
jgi:hypothetical protein